MLCIFALALTVSEKLTFNNFGLQKVVQGHGVQFSQLQHSMANVQLYKCLLYNFALNLTISEIKFLKKFDLRKVSQGHGVQFS